MSTIIKLPAPSVARQASERMTSGANLFAFPLSPSQEQLWLANRQNQGDPAHNLSFRWSVKGALDIAVLERTVNEVVQRHESLRTSFIQVDGQPVQLIADSAKLNVDVIDLRRLPKDERDEQMDRICADHSMRSFDIEECPLLRVALVRMRDDEQILSLTLHSLVADGWSIRLIIEEMQQIYTAMSERRLSPLAQPSLQFVDYMLWQRDRLSGDELVRQTAYWNGKLANYRRFDIGSDLPARTERSTRSDVLTVSVSRDVTDRLRIFGNDFGSTMFTTALAAFVILLHRVTGERDIAIGSPVAGRDRTETEGLIGPLVNHVIYRIQFAGDPEFRNLASVVRDTVWEAMANQDVPFANVVKTLKDSGQPCPEPFYSVNFVCQRAFGGTSRFDFSGAQVSGIPSKSPGALYDLNFFMIEREAGWSISLEYRTDLYSQSRSNQILNDFRELLEAVAADPNRKVSQFPLSGPDLVPQIPKEEPIADLTKSPTDDDQVYALPATVTQHRYWLLAKIAPDSGAFNLPACVRISGPLSREILENSLQVVVDRHEILRTAFDEIDGKLVQLISAKHKVSLPVTDLEPIGSGEREIKLQDLLRNEARRCFDLRQSSALRAHLYRVTSTDHVLIVTLHHIVADGWSHDILQRDLWSAYEALSENREPTLPPLEIQYGDVALWQQDFLQSDQAHQHLAYWTSALKGVTVSNFPIARRGSNIPSPHEAQAMETLSLHKDLMLAVKHLAQSEQTTAFTVMWTCFSLLLSLYTRQNDVVIGTPVANRAAEAEALIGPFAGPTALRLDLSGNPTVRELLNRASGVTSSALTHSILPFETILRELKVRSVHGRNPLFQFYFMYQAAFLRPRELPRLTVTPLPTVSLGTSFELQLSIIERHDGTVAKLEFNANLIDSGTARRILKDYLTLLQRCIANQELSIASLQSSNTANVDTPEEDTHPDQSALSYVAPRTNHEMMLIEVWSQLFDAQFGIRDDFFDLGGNSLLAAQLASEVEKRTGITILLSTLTVARTIEQLARHIVMARENAGSSALSSPASTTPILFCVPGIGGHSFQYRDLAPILSQTRPVHLLHREVEESAFSSLRVENQAALYLDDIRQLQKHGPYQLCGYSFGGHVAYELAQRLKAEGEQVSALIILDTANSDYYRNMPFSQAVRFWSTYAFDRILKYCHWMVRLEFSTVAKAAKFYFMKRMPLLFSSLGGARSKPVLDNPSSKDVHDPIYVPKRYSGRVLVIRAEGRTPEYRHSPSLGWNEAASGPIEIFSVPGDHLSFLLKPNAEHLAGKINAYLSDEATHLK